MLVRMKKRRVALSIGLFVILVVILGIYVITSQSTPTTYCFTPESNIPSEIQGTTDYEYVNFEGALGFVTDVVIAQCVGYRPFGENATEIEFVVSEWVVGEPRAIDDDADRIFVYVENHLYASVAGREVDFQPNALTFMNGTDYLLPLHRTGGPYSSAHDNGFRFGTGNIVIDLGEPENSVMYTESLSNHTTGLNLYGEKTKYEIIAYVQERTEGNPPGIPDFIRSEEIEDIINGSPYILIVEINEPFRLTSGTSDWMSTDIYYVTLVEVLKGDINVENVEIVIFFADTVFQGERHIVAVEGDHDWLRFTSRNSLFSMDQLDEILEILGD